MLHPSIASKSITTENTNNVSLCQWQRLAMQFIVHVHRNLPLLDISKKKIIEINSTNEQKYCFAVSTIAIINLECLLYVNVISFIKID